MKFNLITSKNNVGQLRLLFSYHCKSRRFFATGVIISPEDHEPGRLERPVRKTSAKAEHYNKQIGSKEIARYNHELLLRRSNGRRYYYQN